MKTYLLNIPNELRKFGQGLDAKALLCSKTWDVLNDEGNKQVFIFQNDGRLLISINGNVTNSTWQFVPTNNSIVITAEGQTTMLRPAFIDGVIFALQKDGTQESLFLIDEQNKTFCPQRTLTEVGAYITKKLEAEHVIARQQRELQEQRERLIRERQQFEQQERERQQCERQKRQQIMASYKNEIDALAKQKKKISTIVIVISSILFVLILALSVVCYNVYDEIGYIYILAIAGVCLWIDTDFIFRFQRAKDDAAKEIIEKYINDVG